MEYFQYNKFIEYIQQENINNIINKYKVNNNTSELLFEIMKLLPKEYIRKIQSKIKDKNEIDKLKNAETYSLQLKNKPVISDSPIYYYYTNIDIINEEIFNLINELFSMEYEEKREFLVGDSQIIMEFKLPHQNSFIIGNYIDYQFVPYILIEFNLQKYFDYYFNNFISKGFKEATKNINMNEEIFSKLNIDENTRIGYAYNLELLEKAGVTNKSQVNQFSEKFGMSSNNNNLKDQKFKSENLEGPNDSNKKNSTTFKEITKKIELSLFMKNQIKALILYYYFTEALKSKILLSKHHSQPQKYSGQFYLIDETWMNLHKTSFLYQELIRQIKTMDSQYSMDDQKQKMENIYNNLGVEYLKLIEDKEKDNIEEMLRNILTENTNIVLDKEKKVLKYDVLNEEILDQINKFSNKILKNLKQRDYLINEGKIIIINTQSYDIKKKYELLICDFNSENDKFIQEFLFNYDSGELMMSHFDDLKKISFKDFKEKYSINEDELTRKNNGNFVIVKTFESNYAKITNIDEIYNNKKKGIKQETKIELDKTKKIHIKFLYRLYIFYQDFNNRINKHQNLKTLDEEGYIINSNLIKTFEAFYYIDQIKDVFTKGNNFNDIMDILPKEYIQNVQRQNEEISTKEDLFYPNTKKYKNLEIKYFINSMILDSNVIKYLYKDKNFDHKLDHSKITYAIAKGKIIVKYENVINIGIVDINNIYNPEILIYCSGPQELTSTFNGVKANTIENFITQIKMTAKNIGKYKENNIVVFINETYIPKTSKLEDTNNPFPYKNYHGSNNNGNLEVLNNSKMNDNFGVTLNQNGNELKGIYPPDNTFENYTSNNNDLYENNSNINQRQNIDNNMYIMQRNQFIYDENQNNQDIDNNNYNKEKAKNEEEEIEIIKKKKKIDNLLYVMIDLQKTNIKINRALNSNSEKEKYYLINVYWFYDYLKNMQLIDIHDNKIINQKINSIIMKHFNSSNKDILNKLKADEKCKKEIDDSLNKLKNHDYSNQYSYVPEICKTKQFEYYNNFILVSGETIKFLFKKPKIPLVSCIFGDNLVLIIINQLLEIYEKKGNQYIPKMIFYFYEKTYLLESIELFKKHKLEEYKKYYLLFNEDYASPIFNQLFDEVGYAYLYNSSIKDYSSYMINDILKALIKLYFNYAKIRFCNNKQRNGKYLLINPEIMNDIKKYYNFYELENKLNQNTISQQIIRSIQEKNNDVFHNIINDKKISIIIKTHFLDMNQQFMNKNIFKKQHSEEPQIEQIQGNNYFYYKNFELIEVDIYEILFNNIDFEQNENLRQCIFENNYIYFEVHENFCFNKYPRNIEICKFNQDNSFSANFLMECNTKNSFPSFKKMSEINGGFDACLKSFQNNNKKEELFDHNGQQIGWIYNLMFNQKRTNIQNVNNNNINPNSNLIQNNMKNINMNINLNNNNLINKNNFVNNNNNNFNFSNQNNNLINNNINNINAINNINFANNNNNFNAFNNNNNNFANNNNNISNFINNQVSNNINNLNNNFNNFNNNNNFNQQYYNFLKDTIKPKKKSIKNEFNAPPLIGLKNVGATCYMNATLQCLSQIEGLINYFKYNDKIKYTIEKHPEYLTESFKYLIENLWPSTTNSDYISPKYVGNNSSNSYFKPEKFKKKISQMNPLFKGVQANDAKDLVNFIIMTLHEELNRKAKNQYANIASNLNIDQCNQNLVFNNFLNNFVVENKSIISGIFYGFTHTITHCLRCKTLKHNFEAFFFLNFPLEEVRKYKLQMLMYQNMMLSNQNMMNNNQLIQQNMQKIQCLNSNIVNIFDCFEYYQKLESFSGENAMYCNNCRMQWPSTYATFLYSGPNILILVLNRGQGIQFRIKLEFNSELNLTPFIEARPQNEIFMYDLIGVVTHMGESGASGHFIATCKSPINGGWYQYNDDLAYAIKNFNSEILNYAMPYILFYQKRA